LFPMLRRCSRAIAAVMLVALSTAQGADTVLTLACQRTMTDAVMEGGKPQPLSMGLILNFTNRTVQGFGTPGLIDYPIKITAWNEVTVTFQGSHTLSPTRLNTWGTIDRVTGDLQATSTQTMADYRPDHLRSEMQARTTDVLGIPRRPQ
jgi:hypothetical protein